ncbi:MAG: HEAT repeat domain-containing protein, partial [Methanoculleus sp.]
MPPRSTVDDVTRFVSRQDLGGLITALESDDAGTRWMAAGGLGELRDPRAITPLIRTLTDPDPDVRWKSAEALGS